MRDYEDLVKSLRYCAEYDCTTVCPRAGTGNGYITRLKKEAADAIEDLISLLTASNEVVANRRPKWISVEERPTKNVCDDGYTGYLVFSDGYIKVADYTCGFYVEGEYDPNVTHYMPLPEPPKEEKE